MRGSDLCSVTNVEVRVETYPCTLFS
ncbi:hypothetical protein LINGRAHAP2_LOCUS12533 [Linum grandiflorum]